MKNYLHQNPHLQNHQKCQQKMPPFYNPLKFRRL
jgi:hypothetical protein